MATALHPTLASRVELARITVKATYGQQVDAKARFAPHRIVDAAVQSWVKTRERFDQLVEWRGLDILDQVRLLDGPWKGATATVVERAWMRADLDEGRTLGLRFDEPQKDEDGDPLYVVTGRPDQVEYLGESALRRYEIDPVVDGAEPERLVARDTVQAAALSMAESAGEVLVKDVAANVWFRVSLESRNRHDPFTRGGQARLYEGEPAPA
jgi:hypothetical protein